MRLFINIRGTNGSGKSTAILQMVEKDKNFYTVVKPYKGKPTKILSVFPRYKVVAIGSYLNKTGGLDTMKNNEITRKAILYALKRFEDYTIIAEGIIASTVYSTYRDLFIEIENNFEDTQCFILNFVPPLQVCIDRVQKRNGGKPVKEELIEGKYKTVLRCHEKFVSDGFVSQIVDTSKINKKHMLPYVLKIIRAEGDLYENIDSD